jgi:hypothetical protein
VGSYEGPTDPFKSNVLRFDFEVGESEKHRVEFRFNQSIGNLRISVDGNPAIRRFRMLSFSTVERYKLTVGNVEKHEVVIEKRRNRAFGGFTPQRCIVYIDGNVNAEY